MSETIEKIKKEIADYTEKIAELQKYLDSELEFERNKIPVGTKVVIKGEVVGMEDFGMHETGKFLNGMMYEVQMKSGHTTYFEPENLEIVPHE